MDKEETRKYIIKRREEGKPEISKKENTTLNTKINILRAVNTININLN